MNKRMRLPIFAAAWLLVIALSACSGSKNNPPAGESQPAATGSATSTPVDSGTASPVADPYRQEVESGKVTLTMYLIGDMPAGQEKVLEQLNVLTQRDINAAVVIKNIPWGDWQAQYNLLFNSGEKFDIAYSTQWADYNGIAAKGGFRAIGDEELRTFLPQTSADLSQESRSYLWEQVKVGGNAYLVPQVYDWQNPYAVIVRGDLREKYGIPEIRTYTDYLNYAKTIGDGEKGIIPINTNGNDDKNRNPLFFDRQWTPLAGLFSVAVDNKADDGKVFAILDRPEVAEWARLNYEIQQAGGYSKSALSSKTIQDDAFKSGSGASSINGVNGLIPIYLETLKTHPEWKPELYDIAAQWGLAPPKGTDGGMAVAATSEHPERAMMLIDLLRNNKEYNDLIGLGVEGLHWEAVGDNKFKALEEGQKNYGPYANAPWGYNTDLMRVDESTPDFILEWRDKWTDQVAPTKLDGFVFDDTPVKAELIAIKNIELSVVPAIQFGLNKDPQRMVADLLEKTKAAGLDKVIGELQKQIDAFIAVSAQ